MARSATVGDSDPRPDPRARHTGPRQSVNRVAVVHTGLESTSDLAERLGAVFDVAEIALSRTLIDQLLAMSPRVVVIEHHPGDFDVLRVCSDLSKHLDAWIIVLFDGSAADDEDLEIALLDAGADDFLPVSTSTAKLAARLRLASRERSTAGLKRGQLTIGDVIIDRDAHALYIAGEPRRCSRLQFQLLAKLAVEVNRVVDGETLLRTVWGTEPESPHPRRLRVAISLLRGVLGTGTDRPRIETVPHVGYRLVLDHPDHGTADRDESDSMAADQTAPPVR